MKRVAQKYTDIALVGQGTAISLIKKILSFQSKLTYTHHDGRNSRFVSANTMVLGGEKVSAKRFLVVLPARQKVHAFTVVGNQPLATDIGEDIEDVAKSTCIIGNDPLAVSKSLALASGGSEVTLLTESPALLDGFDTTVQDMVERHLKKQGVNVVKAVNILSLEPSGNSAHVTVETGGASKRISTERLVIVPETTYSMDIGLGNISSNLDHIDTKDVITKIDDFTLLMKDTHNLELSSVYKIVDFLKGKASTDFTTTRRLVHVSDGLTFFSIGIVEQDYFSTHLNYKKSLIKVQSSSASSVRGFMKVLTSTHNKIIGIHSVLPFEYQNIDLLIDLVERGGSVSDLRNSCLVDDQLTSTYVEILGDLGL